MDDRDDDGAQQAGGVEGEGGLHPVGQLKGDDVAGADAAPGQAAGDVATGVEDVGERARPGANLGAELEGLRRPIPETVGEHPAEAVRGPETVCDVALHQLGRDEAGLPLQAHPRRPYPLCHV